MNERPEFDDEGVVRLVGLVVMNAAMLEEALVDLWVETGRKQGRAPVSKRSTGASGKPLVAGLQSVGLAGWADRYSALAEDRNAVVHGRWTLSSEPGVWRSVRAKQGAAARGQVTGKVWPPGALERLVDDLWAAWNEAGAEVLQAIGLPDGLVRTDLGTP